MVEVTNYASKWPSKFLSSHQLVKDVLPKMLQKLRKFMCFQLWFGVSLPQFHLTCGCHMQVMTLFQ
jgi:hypothetical protein